MYFGIIYVGFLYLFILYSTQFMNNSSRPSFTSLLLTGVFILGLAACKKDPPIPDYSPPDSSFGLVYTHIMAPSCGVNGCHDGSSIHPRLRGENTYHSMVTEHLHNVEAENAGLHLVKPFSSDSSFLYQKMIYDSSLYQFGSPMPQGGLTVTLNQIEFLRQWIDAGAPELGHVADRSLVE